jgi:hypothetical protein
MFDERKLDVLDWIGLTGDLAFRAKMVFPHRLDPKPSLEKRRSGRSPMMFAGGLCFFSANRQ